jgi:hypothetical protein
VNKSQYHTAETPQHHAVYIHTVALLRGTKRSIPRRSNPRPPPPRAKNWLPAGANGVSYVVLVLGKEGERKGDTYHLAILLIQVRLVVFLCGALCTVLWRSRTASVPVIIGKVTLPQHQIFWICSPHTARQRQRTVFVMAQHCREHALMLHDFARARVLGDEERHACIAVLQLSDRASTRIDGLRPRQYWAMSYRRSPRTLPDPEETGEERWYSIASYYPQPSCRQLRFARELALSIDDARKTLKHFRLHQSRCPLITR